MNVRMLTRAGAMALVVLCALPCASRAQEVPKYAFTGAFAYTRIEDSNWTGWHAAASRSINQYLGVAINIGSPVSRQTGAVQAYEGMTFHADRRAYTIMAGPKLTFAEKNRVAPFVQLLLGAAHESVNIENHEDGVVIRVSNYRETDFAMSLGLGVDYALKGPLALRGEFDYAGWRKNATVMSPSYWEKGVRLSLGLTLRFGTLSR